MKQSVRTILSQIYCIKIFIPKLRIGSSLSSLKGNSASLELFSLHEHDQHFFSFILVHVRRDVAIEQEKIDLFKSFERRMNDSIQSWFASLNDIRKIWGMCIFTPGSVSPRCNEIRGRLRVQWTTLDTSASTHTATTTTPHLSTARQTTVVL